MFAIALVLGTHVSGQHSDVETALVGTGLSGTGSADSDGQIHVGIKFHVGIDQRRGWPVQQGR